MVKLEIFLIVVFCFHELYELQEDVIVKTMDQILIHEGTHNRTGAYINAVHTPHCQIGLRERTHANCAKAATLDHQ